MAALPVAPQSGARGLKRKPDIVDALLACIDDGCPPEPDCYLCQYEDGDSGDMCARCWRAYALYLAGRRAWHPYHKHISQAQG